MRFKDYLKITIGFVYKRLIGLKSGKACYIALNSRWSGFMGGVILGDYVHISSGSRIDLQLPTSRLTIDSNAILGHHSQIACRYHIIIENGVLTAPRVFISDHNHGYKDVTRPIYMNPITGNEDSRLVIGEGSWLGINSVVVGSVKIGKHCVIGANTVVTHDIPDYSVVVGCPAKIIRRYNLDSKCWVNT